MSVTVVVGAQFGDEGKGKIVDAVVEEHGVRMVIRYNGGANAGHTVVIGDQTFKLHQVPSGIFHRDAACLIGNGAVVDPAQLSRELEELASRGVSTENFFVSSRAHLVMPWHPLIDRAAEARRGAKAIGTTGRGIGPCYEDKAGRRGLRVGDLLRPGALADRVRELAELKRLELRDFPDILSELPSEQAVIDGLGRSAATLGRHVRETDEMAREAWHEGDGILLEGAQGTMLDLDLGTYPHVSSSLATAAGACVGSGLPPRAIDEVICVAKAYTTRVGNGPFPTELDLDPLGDRLREAGKEFGTTTGRPRRCGWFDAVIVRRSCEINGADGIVLTKLDVLSGFDELKIAVEHPDAKSVIYERPLPGWQQPIADCTSWRKLPKNARRYVERIEALCDTPVVAVATGPGRDAVIWR